MYATLGHFNERQNEKSQRRTCNTGSGIDGPRANLEAQCVISPWICESAFDLQVSPVQRVWIQVGSMLVCHAHFAQCRNTVFRPKYGGVLSQGKERLCLDHLNYLGDRDRGRMDW